jgi:hypothetical protein
MSMMTVFDGSQKAAKSSATLLLSEVSGVTELEEKEIVLSYRLRGHSEPSVVCHTNAFIIERKDALTLMPIPQ